MNVEHTRELMLDAAERLFAEKGIDATTVSEVHRIAGQSNKSAVHYHFGSREGLVQAVVARHHEVQEARRARLLESVDGDLHELVGALVRPAASNLATSGGRRYLRILPQLAHRAATEQLTRPSESTALRRNLEGLGDCMTEVESEVRTLRLTAALSFLIDALGTRAREIDVHPDGPAVGHEDFVANVEAMIVGLLTQPVDGSGPAPAG